MRLVLGTVSYSNIASDLPETEEQVRDFFCKRRSPCLHKGVSTRGSVRERVFFSQISVSESVS